MEKNIAAQKEAVLETILRNFPPFGDAWPYVQAVVELHQTVEKCIHSPNVALGARKSRVKRRDGIVLVVAERRAALWLSALFGGTGKETRKEVWVKYKAHGLAKVRCSTGAPAPVFSFSTLDIITPELEFRCYLSSLRYTGAGAPVLQLRVVDNVWTTCE